MKKLLTLLIGFLFAVTLSAQHSNSYTYPFYIGKAGTSTGSITLYGTTSGTVQLTVPDIAGTGTIFKLPSSNGTSGYVLRTDGAGTLSWISLTGYATLASPTFTGTVILPSATSIGDVSSTEIGYINNVTSAIQTQFTGKVGTEDTASMLGNYALSSETFSVDDATELGTILPLQSDTTTLFVWSVGIGAAGDTANFRTLVTHGYDYGGFKWEGSDTLVVTKLIGVTSTGGNLAIQVSWDVNYLDATPTNLNTSAPAITSTITGDSDTSFDNAEIPPGVWVWLTTPTVTAQPKKLRVSVIGYKRNLSY